MERVSSHNTFEITEHHTGESSGNAVRNDNAPTSPFKASVYFSPRIQRMIEDTTKFRSEVEFDIENSRVHWSELSNSGSASTGLGSRIRNKRPHWGRLLKFFKVPFDRKIKEDYTESTDNSDNTDSSDNIDNHEYFEKLKQHPEWGGFFKDIKVVLGEKINEGSQAEIFDAKVEFDDGLEFDYGSHVVKVMKGDNSIYDFQRQWPVGMLCNVSRGTDKDPLLWIKGGTLINNRFSFVMVKQWGDLRKLIDLKKIQNVKNDGIVKDIGFTSRPFLSNKPNSQGPPFVNIAFIWKIMLCIAEDMDRLHTKYGIVHRDLKASNILLWSLGEELPDKNSDVRAHVVDYECCVGVIGTGFWRAPEILVQLKKGVPGSKIIFTKMSDIYSYGMVCYEILTGCIPFEDHPFQDYNYVLKGKRPKLPTWIKSIDYMNDMIQSCWDRDPSRRPTFSSIVATLLRGGSEIPPWWPTPEALGPTQKEASKPVKDTLIMNKFGYGFRGSSVISIIENRGVPDEGVTEFIAGFAKYKFGDDATEAASSVIYSVANRTHATFTKTLRLVLLGEFEDAREEFEGLIRIHENLSPVENSRILEGYFKLLKADFRVEARRKVLELYISYGGSNTEWLAREALGIW